MENLDYDIEGLFQEAKERAVAEGSYTHESWREIVDDLLQVRAETGEISDEDVEDLKEKLVGRFGELEGQDTQA